MASYRKPRGGRGPGRPYATHNPAAVVYVHLPLNSSWPQVTRWWHPPGSQQIPARRWALGRSSHQRFNLALYLQVWEGDGVVASFRKLVGATNPLTAEPGTIRGDFGRVTGRNIVHASDSPDNGVREAGTTSS